ncbi:MAG: hypothetical protein AAB792_00650 [Patescibacteria group bacterium]
MLSNFFQLIKPRQSDIVLAVTIILISVISFNLGKISSLNGQKAQIKITGGENAGQPEDTMGTFASPKPSTLNPNSPVVASKNSKSKLYHFTWCPGASQIAEKNKITFVNEAAAIAAGYTLAGNCRK